MAATGPVARRVDHVNLRVSDPRPLHRVFADRLGLPVLWPPAALPGFEIAAVSLGNAHIEPTRFGLRSKPSAAPARLYTVALEPEADAVAELGRRGVPHTAKVPFVGVFPREAETDLFHRRTPGDGPDLLWTWIFVGGFVGDRMLERQYSGRLFQSPGFGSRMGRLLGGRRAGAVLNTVMAPRRPYPFFVEWNAYDAAAFRRRAQEELERREGGPLGVVRLKEVVVGASDLAAESARWTKLLGAHADGGAWELGDGPAVRLVADDEDRMRSLVWEVASLERAQRFLHDERMLGPEADGGVQVDPAAVFGAEILLVESV